MSTPVNLTTAIFGAPTIAAESVVLACTPTDTAAQPVLINSLGGALCIERVQVRAFTGVLKSGSVVAVQVTQAGNTRTIATLTTTADVSAADAALILTASGATTGNFLVLPGQTVNLVLTPAASSTGQCKCDVVAFQVL